MVDPLGISYSMSREITILATAPIFILGVIGDTYFNISNDICLGLLIIALLGQFQVQGLLILFRLKSLVKKAVDGGKQIRYEAINLEHICERFQLFIMLLFGEVILGIEFDVNTDGHILTWYTLGAALVLVVAVGLQTIFFDVECGRTAAYSFRRGGAHARRYMILHVLLGSAILVMGSTSSEMLHFLILSESLSQNLVWMYCCGLGCVVLFLATMSSLYEHLSDYRICKTRRTILKLAVAVVICMKPLWISTNYLRPLLLLVLN